MLVANDLPRNGPSGTYSQAWMSRALQSLRMTTPNRWSRASRTETRVPRVVGPVTTNPISHSMSSVVDGPNGGRPSRPGRR